MAISADLNHSPLALGLVVLHVFLAEAWFDWRGTSNLYLSLFFCFSSVLVAMSFTFLFELWPDFWGFLGSAILAEGLGGVVRSLCGGLGVYKATRHFPSFFEVVSHVVRLCRPLSNSYSLAD